MVMRRGALPTDPIYPLRLDAERRTRWQERADQEGVPLAKWIRRVCDLAASEPRVSDVRRVPPEVKVELWPADEVLADPPAAAPVAVGRPARARRPRTEMCEHRRKADEFCSRCDG